MVEADFLQGRVAMYELLAQLYVYPLENAALDAIMVLGMESGPASFADALGVMQARIGAASDRPSFLEALNVEATRLFEGPGQPAAPAYASFYLNQGQLMGPSALAARRAYLAWNAKPREDGRVPPDHLAIELGFMAWLSRATISAAPGHAREALTASAEFLDRHLLTWATYFDASVVAATQHPFFVGLANLTRAFLESDRQWLEDILEFQGQPFVMENTR